jgi:retinol dehydrogenase 12
MPPLGDILSFLHCQAFGRPRLPSNVDLTGRTIIITGANAGLGLEASRHVARMHATRLILACRNVEKGERAKQTILKDTSRGGKTEVIVWELDMCRQASVAAFVERVKGLDRIDAFVANAGVELEILRLAEGVEETLKVNILSTFALSLGILPKLAETAKATGIETHLTLVGSLIHYFGADADLHAVPEGESIYDTLSDPKKAKMGHRYPLSKLMEHLCFNEFVAGGDIPSNVVINLVNPGWCGTELSRNRGSNVGERFMFAIMGRTGEEGSRTLVHGLCADVGTHGKYLSECQVKRQSTYVDSDRGQQMARRLWKETLARLEM